MSRLSASSSVTACAYACAIVVGLGACRGGSSGVLPTVTVYAIAGSGIEPAPGLTILTSEPDGSIVDDQQTDPTGAADVGVQDDSLISIFFTPAAGSGSDDDDGDGGPQTITVVTTSVPANDTLTVHGPPAPAPALIVGGLMIMPQEPLGADVFEIDLGCTVVQAATLPTSVDVPGACLGTDANVDVLVRGYVITNGVSAVVGYAAGRTTLQSEAGMIGMFTPATWSTDTTSVPVTIDPGVTPMLDWTLYADTLPFDADAPIGSGGTLWDGLMVDHVVVDGSIPAATLDSGGQAVERQIAGVPTSIEVGSADFMAPLASGITIDTRSPFAVHWTEAGPTGADAVDARLAWTGNSSDDNGDGASGSPTIWEIVLAPGANAIAFPALDDTLSAIITLPAIDTQTDPVTTDLRYLDSSDLASFDDVQNAALFATATSGSSPIVPPPAMSTPAEVRVSDSASTQ